MGPCKAEFASDGTTLLFIAAGQNETFALTAGMM